MIANRPGRRAASCPSAASWGGVPGRSRSAGHVSAGGLGDFSQEKECPGDILDVAPATVRRAAAREGGPPKLPACAASGSSCSESFSLSSLRIAVRKGAKFKTGIHTRCERASTHSKGKTATEQAGKPNHPASGGKSRKKRQAGADAPTRSFPLNSVTAGVLPPPRPVGTRVGAAVEPVRARAAARYGRDRHSCRRHPAAARRD